MVQPPEAGIREPQTGAGRGDGAIFDPKTRWTIFVFIALMIVMGVMTFLYLAQ
jgi:hypothetical protein